MGIAGAGIVVVGMVGVICAVLTWLRLRRATKLLKAALRLHDQYLEKLKGKEESEARKSTA